MSRVPNKTLESIKYVRGKLSLLDQRKLPQETVYDEIHSIQDIYDAIKEMRVRGAPAIAVTAALGIAVVAQEMCDRGEFKQLFGVDKFIAESSKYLITSRPTAVNLANTLNSLNRTWTAQIDCSPQDVVNRLTEAAEAVYAEDVAFNENIMQHGAKHILASAPRGTSKVRVMTICNTGALATSRYGTALGVVRQLFYDNHLEQVYACETRPWNQGARLTVYECVQEGMPCTLICDSAVSALMNRTRVDAVVVGADRICQNGDTANKIGTYNLAVAAKYHGVPFYVAAPTTTLDSTTPSGKQVTIEERPPTEITTNMATKERTVADGPTLTVWNPVFDITPGELITGGIITEKGVIRPAKKAPYYNIAGIIAAPPNPAK